MGSYKDPGPSHPVGEAPIGEWVRLSSRAKQAHKVIGLDLFGNVLLVGKNGEKIATKPYTRAYFETGIERINRMLAVWNHYYPDQKDKDIPDWMK